MAVEPLSDHDDMTRSDPTPRQLRAARDEFRRLLQARAKEPAWQRFFAANPYVLTTALPLRVAPRDIVPLGRPGRSEPDFVFYPHEPRSHPCYGVIELKRPDSSILTVPRRDIITLSRDVATALAQAQAYASQLRRNLTGIYGTHFFFGNPSQLFLIMGVSDDLVTRVPNQIDESALDGLLPKDCRLIPYDTLLQMFEEAVPPSIVVLWPQASALLNDRPLEKTIVKELFDAMPSAFNASRAQGLNAIIQYDITGHGGGHWHVIIDNAVCSVIEGSARNANLTLEISAEDWLDMSSGKQSGQMLFMSGRLKLRGDMALAMKLGTLFGR